MGQDMRNEKTSARVGEVQEKLQHMQL